MKDAGNGICTRTGPLKGFPPASKTGASASSATPAFEGATGKIFPVALRFAAVRVVGSEVE